MNLLPLVQMALDCMNTMQKEDNAKEISQSKYTCEECKEECTVTYLLNHKWVCKKCNYGNNKH